MSLDVATGIMPRDFLAGLPIIRQVALGIDDGAQYGTPDDLSDVIGARVSAQMRVARGITAPAATIWALNAGVTIGSTQQPNGLTYPTLIIAAEAGLAAGTYDVLVSLTRGGATDWVLREVWQITAQP